MKLQNMFKKNRKSYIPLKSETAGSSGRTSEEVQ